MSDYIYGSSLRAAKSKANYLFEGDFRRRPAQNFSGASRSFARDDLLRQAAEQRQSREDLRRKEQATVLLQSAWRGYQCRKLLAAQMRVSFDRFVSSVEEGTSITSKSVTTNELEQLVREFIICYHGKHDESRFDVLMDLMMSHQDIVIRSKNKEPSIWTWRIKRILILNLSLLKRFCTSASSKNLLFLERFTRLNDVLNEHEAVAVWQSLAKNKIFSILRYLIDSNEGRSSPKHNLDDDFAQLLLELIRRSLDFKFQQPQVGTGARPSLVLLFFTEFLRGPVEMSLDTLFFPDLLKLEPRGLHFEIILSEFCAFQTPIDLNYPVDTIESATSPAKIQELSDAVWLSYHFVKAIYHQIDRLNDGQKVLYADLLSRFLRPAIFVTNISLMLAAQSDEAEQLDEDDDVYDDLGSTDQFSQYYSQVNSVINKLVKLINEPAHVQGLRSIIFNANDPASNPAQRAIIQICNLMLAHESLAIFNCRLLYTIAFCKGFLDSLWVSITTSTKTSLYSTNNPIYLQISRGTNPGNESWSMILPNLRLFCALFSYLLPTIDDKDLKFEAPPDALGLGQEERQSKAPIISNRDLINICAILRDLCVGIVEILHQDNNPFQLASVRASRDGPSIGDRLLSFEIKLCFKALVRLIRQLHARNSRQQFCPDGHWICPSLVIPANKGVDFKLVTSHQGRLLNQMTKEATVPSERSGAAASEIKTVLILQEFPFVIAFYDRVQILHHLLYEEKRIHHSEGYHFGLPGTAIQVQIRRNYIYEDAFEKLSMENEPNMKLPLKISLINAAGLEEAGIDGGGLTKEFLSELLKAGFDPMRGFFKSTSDQMLYPNPSAKVLFSSGSFGVHYEFLGRVLGKAIFEKIMVELPLASFFLAKLLARRHSSDVDMHNLASLDPVLYKNLVYLKNYKGDVTDLNLDFTISNNELGEREVVELKPGGAKIPVTNENKIEYVHLVADYRLNKQIRVQCAAFKRGLAQLIDLDWLRMFDPRELQILISGAPTPIDLEDWRRNSVYTNGYTDESEAIDVFWRVIGKFDEIQRRKLLKFATSCSFVPLLGFKDLVPRFTIAMVEESRLPTASTCMNLLKLPQCNDEATMRSRLLYAIESNSGFELS